jgi:Ca2+-binding EF-hand superfamily protein
MSLVFTWILAGVVVAAAAGQDKKDPKKQPAQRPPGFLKDTPDQFIKRFDKNKDGFLTRDELPPFLARQFGNFDTNGDGKLDKKEVAALLKTLRQRYRQVNRQQSGQGAGNPQVERIVNDILRRMDKDKDGKISKKEAQGQVALNFDLIDTNKDGFVDRQELRRWAARFAGRQNPQRTGPDFDDLDLNADGRLTREELKNTPYYKVFDEIDTNKDGKIDRKEFEAYLKKKAAKK